MFSVWLAWRYLNNRRRWLNTSTVLAILGMGLGVAALIVAMAVVSGFVAALKQAVADVSGEVLVIKSGGRIREGDGLRERLKKISPDIIALSPFIQLEGLIAARGRISGVLLQGLDPGSVHRVLRLRPRLVQGRFDLLDDPGHPPLLVGRGLFSKLKLQLGDTVKVVMPNPNLSQLTGFSPRAQAFRVQGVLDLGKYEFDERVVITSLAATQRLSGFGDSFSGYRLKIKDHSHSDQVNLALSRALGYPYWIRDWQQLNQNLLEAVKLEKAVIFFVVLIMVVAASFNIASTLFVTVLSRYADIGILKTMGASKRLVMAIFSVHGMVIGFAGTFLGLLLGLSLCWVFQTLEDRLSLLPGEIYRLTKFGFELRALDLLAIFVASFVICLLATLIPARKGAQMDVIEGLRYD